MQAVTNYENQEDEAEKYFEAAQKLTSNFSIESTTNVISIKQW
jgi:hypothetical protein